MEQTAQKIKTSRFYYDDGATLAFLDHLSSLPWDELTLVCVGTDRSTGDSFAPLVGSILKDKFKEFEINIPIVGTLDEPVHAVTLASTVERLAGRKVLALDACLGKHDHVGQIILEDTPLRAGAGVGKSLPEIGQWSLTGVVNISGFMEYFVLQNTRLGFVMNMAKVTANTIFKTVLKERLTSV